MREALFIVADVVSEVLTVAALCAAAFVAGSLS